MPAGQEDVKYPLERVPRRLRFGAFEVDLESRDLRKSGRQVKLQRKPFQIMELLLRTRGRFASRDELTRELWPDLHVNFNRSLNTAVNSLRKALGDSSQNPSYIETRPGLGYRFIAPVEEVIPNRVDGASPAADANCAKAQYFLNKQTPADLHKASAYFQAALEEDPRCVRAHAGLAETYCLFALMNMAAPAEAGPRARASAMTALRLDPGSASAHAAMARVKRFFEWDWPGAAEKFHRAMALDTHCAALHQAYGSLLSSVGNIEGALHELQMAQELDPISPAVHVEMAWVLYLARDFAKAHEQCWKMLVLEPNFSAAQHMLGLVCEQMGLHDEAVIELQNAQASGGEQPAVIAALGYAWAKAGKTAEAKDAQHTLQLLSAKRFVSPYWHAMVCTGLGQHRAAAEWLEKAYLQHDVWLVWLGVDPRFEDLRSTPGFQSVLDRMQLEPLTVAQT